MAAHLRDVVLGGSWNADAQGHHYVDLDMRIQITSAPDAVLSVLDIGPDMIADITEQQVYKLENGRHLDPDPRPDTADQQPPNGEIEDEVPYQEEEDASSDDVSIKVEETPRKLFTRGMRISPSPFKKRLFPPSPDICEEGENSDDDAGEDEDNNSSGSSNEKVRGIANDEGVFDMSEDDAGRQEWHNHLEATFTKGLQPRVRLADLSFGIPWDNINMDVDVDNKENEVPDGEDECKRLGSRVPLGELVPTRDLTAVRISSPNPNNEAPVIVNSGNDITPSRIPNSSIVVPKRTSRSIVQNGPVSRIPIKRIYKDESSGSDRAPVNVIGPQDGTASPQFTHKRSSPIARMAIMARALSNSRLSTINADAEADEKDLDIQSSNAGPTASTAMQSFPEVDTPTKFVLPRSSSDYGSSAIGNSDDCMWPTEGSAGERNTFAEADENQVSEPLFSQQNENGDTDNAQCQPLLLEEMGPPPGYSEYPEFGNFDIDVFYGQDDQALDDDPGSEESCSYEEGLDEEGSAEGYRDGSIDLPSPSTASQRSMMWYCTEALTDADAASENPILDVANGVLTIRTTSNAIPGIFLIVAKVRLTLTGALANNSEEFKAALPEDDIGHSIPWRMTYKPPNIDGWALNLCMMLPFPSTAWEDSTCQKGRLGGDVQEQAPLVYETDGGGCPCCSYHLHNSPLVNKERLIAMAGVVTQRLSIGSRVVKEFFKDLQSNVDVSSRAYRKTLRDFGVMLSNICGEKGPVHFIIYCIKLASLAIVLFIIGPGMLLAKKCPYARDIGLSSQPAIISPMPEEIGPSVCGGMDLSLRCPGAAGSVWKPVDISGAEAASETTTAAAAVTWAVHPVGCGEEGEHGRAAMSTESGSLPLEPTAPIRALPEIELQQQADSGGDGPASGLDGAVDAADDGGNTGSGDADKANDARRESLRDRVDWALGWRGPLFD
ncbi:uncharacterized protein GIQ15_04132 [Arthroderma uncinatum]|uniref:uncharacterized protein n=1 Tax=Arthroderma uncinatum TaxID=74035 RepID=UPI00144AC43C|nr:uncharacterized protein GIQ15_04132 [Arthroderma uncinatum]KAF3481373.1 hypothetical protein GIQ15_04132 [Arthroderma uncinatum]